MIVYEQRWNSVEVDRKGSDRFLLASRHLMAVGIVILYSWDSAVAKSK
jgi:hypothetical protein